MNFQNGNLIYKLRNSSGFFTEKFIKNLTHKIDMVNKKNNKKKKTTHEYGPWTKEFEEQLREVIGEEKWKRAMKP